MDLDNLSDYGLNGEPWASSMFLRVLSNFAEGLAPKECHEKQLHVPVGFVFIIDPKYGPTAKVKLPGGGSEPEDKTPRDTAVRETFEETGIMVSPERVHLADKIFKKYRNAKEGMVDHWRCYFYADIYEYEAQRMTPHSKGNEGEYPLLQTYQDLQEKIDKDLFLRDHLDALVRAGLLMLPLKRKLTPSEEVDKVLI